MSKNDIFSSLEYEKAYQEIKKFVIHNKTSVAEPIAIVLGGQPGAGKSNLYTIASVLVIVQHQTFKKIMI